MFVPITKIYNVLNLMDPVHCFFQIVSAGTKLFEANKTFPVLKINSNCSLLRCFHGQNIASHLLQLAILKGMFFGFTQ